jgi:phosphatidate cytidylyltransferase
VSELTKRVIFALIAAPIFIVLVYLGGMYFWLLMLVISLITTWEVVNLFKAASIPTDYWPSVLLTLGWMTIPFHTLESTFLISAFLLIIVKETLTPPHGRYLSILTSIFASIYPAWGFLSFYKLRIWESDASGFLLLLVVLIMIWGNDTFAYFFGKNFGKHKMAPEISPAKTWEGFIGGFVGSSLVLAVFIYFVEMPYSPILLAPLAVIVSTFGPIGDLSESKIKRFAGKKDSSNLLPGHGGFFDRFDSIILVSPVVMLYLELIKSLSN